MILWILNWPESPCRTDNRPWLFTGCTAGNTSSKDEDIAWDHCRIYLQQLGENANDSGSFVYEKSVDGHSHGALEVYDIASGESTEIFRISSGEKYIDEVYYVGDDVFFSVEASEGRGCFKYRSKTGKIESCQSENGEIVDPDWPLYSLGDGTAAVAYAYVNTPEYGKVTFTKRLNESQFYYSLDEQNFYEMTGLTDKSYDESGIEWGNLSYSNGKVYGVLTAVGMSSKVSKIVFADMKDVTTEQVKKDLLFSFDPATCESEKLYETENGYSRIVGFHGDWVYIFKNGNLSRVSLSSQKSEGICDLDPGDITFSCIGTKLVVFNPNTEKVVKVVSMTD
ncbi:MAG: hypothetical protein K5739_00235 [Lachnospiraceae bacterium]|nr:hypothetical protein [Lachnospiraceae bacterium]